MPASKVYFTDFRCRNGVSQLDKLRKLLEKSEFSQIDFDGKFVAIKLHFGELGNLSFLRANYAKVVADFIKERGGRPFITDCNTLYVGSRKNALEHMDTAYLNGYSPFSTGCHVIIADGKPYVKTDLCVGCGACAKICAHNGPQIENKKCRIDQNNCVGCGRCIAVCPKDAIHPTFQASVRLLNCKIAEYAKAVLDGRPSYCINIVRDVSPNCDCHPENDVPIVPDVGMFASADPVALDLACAEAINRQPVLPNSAITDLKHEHDCDRFHAAHDNTHWQDLIEHGKKLGIGQDTYELVTIR